MSIFKKNYFRVIPLILFILSISGCMSLQQQQSSIDGLRAKLKNLQIQVDVIQQEAIQQKFDSQQLAKLKSLKERLSSADREINRLREEYEDMNRSGPAYQDYLSYVRDMEARLNDDLTSIGSLIATDPSLRMGL